MRKLLQKLGWLLGITAVCAVSVAQSGYTTVTGTISSCYANGSVQANWVNQSGGSTFANLYGSAFPQTVPTSITSTANWIFKLADVNQVTPGPGQSAWNITACAKSGSQPLCYTQLIAVTGATMDVTSFFAGAPIPNGCTTSVTNIVGGTGISVTNAGSVYTVTNTAPFVSDSGAYVQTHPAGAANQTVVGPLTTEGYYGPFLINPTGTLSVSGSTGACLGVGSTQGGSTNSICVDGIGEVNLQSQGDTISLIERFSPTISSDIYGVVFGSSDFVPPGSGPEQGTKYLWEESGAAGGVKGRWDFLFDPQVPTAAFGDSSANTASTLFVSRAVGPQIVTPVGRTCNSSGCYSITGDGTIIERGTVTAATTGATLQTVAITFPFTFAALPTLTLGAGSGPDSTNNDSMSVYYTDLTTTGATVVLRCANNIGGSGCPSISNAIPVTWTAIY